MKNLVAFVIITLFVLFCVGAANSNYNCVSHLCDTLRGAVNLVGDLLHTEMAGVSVVAKIF